MVRASPALPFTSLSDHGFQLQASAMVIPRGAHGLADGHLHTKRSPVGGASLPYVVGGSGDTFYTSFVLNF